MKDSHATRHARRGLSAVALGLWAAVVATPSSAQRREAPDELVVGPFLLAPSLEFAVDRDSNVRREEVEDETSSDTYTSVAATLEALLPFRKSSFALGITADNVEYEKNSFASDVATDFFAELDLAFADGQRLLVSEQFRHDFTQVRDPTVPDVAPGETPEEIFFGEPYHENRIRLQADKVGAGRRGYLLRVDREDFVYKGEQVSGLYDYRGFEGLFQYYHPLASYKRLIGHYELRRFNHYDPEAPEACVGVPFRREIADSVELGLEGASRGDYLVRMGWGRFQYERQGENCFPEDASDQASAFRGITGFARWRQPLGARTALIAIGSRRPLPSNLNTYYTSNTLRLVGERYISEVLSTVLEFGYDSSRYADEEATAGFGCDGKRTDQRWEARASANWTVHRLLSTRASYTHDQRNSNCELSGYSSDSISFGLSLGW